MRLHLLTTLFVLMGLISGCGASSGTPTPPDPDTPTVTGVSPTGVPAGAVGQSVRFTAAFTGDVTTWAWDFGAAATPRTSSDASPEVVLGAAGTYSATVQASNGDGASTPFTFSIEITPEVSPLVPQVTGVEPGGIVGSIGTPVTFRATATNNPTDWFWDFGDAISPSIVTAAAPFVQLEQAGVFEGSVIARNAHGGSTPFNFTFTISPNDDAPVVLEVFPGGEIGGEDETVTFSAQLFQGPAIEAEWDFGGGASSTTPGFSTPDVKLGLPGSYTGSLRVRNDCCWSEPFTFTYSVKMLPPILDEAIPFVRSAPPGEDIAWRTDSSRSPERWRWEFGTGTIDGTVESTEPQGVIQVTTSGFIGRHTGRVVAINAAGESGPYLFDYWVLPTAPPVINAVTPVAPVGPPGSVVEFMVDATQAPHECEWDITSGIDFVFTSQLTTSGKKLRVTLKDPGTHHATVIARNDAGDSAPFPFTFRVEGNPPPAWLATTITERVMPLFQFGALVHDGRLAIVHRTVEDATSIFRRALTADPQSPADWQVIALPELERNALSLVNGRFAIAGIFQGELSYHMATVDEPASDLDWSRTEISHGVEHAFSIPQTSPHPVVVYYTQGEVRVAQSTHAVPAATSDWDIHTVETVDTDYGVNMTAHNGGFAILYHRDQELMVGQSGSYPSSAGSWHLHALANPVTDKEITTHQDRLVVSYALQSNTYRVAIANVAMPQSASDWTTSDPGLYRQNTCEILSSGGRLVALIGNPIRVSRALTSLPAAMVDWQPGEPPNAFFGFQGRIVDFGDSWGLIYPQRDEATGYDNLQFVRPAAPW